MNQRKPARFRPNHDSPRLLCRDAAGLLEECALSYEDDAEIVAAIRTAIRGIRALEKERKAAQIIHLNRWHGTPAKGAANA